MCPELMRDLYPRRREAGQCRRAGEASVWAVRTWLIPLLALWVFAPVHSAQTDMVIWDDGHPVHPTRILARMAEPARPDASAALTSINTLGSKLERRYLVPGLVLFEDTVQRAPASIARPDDPIRHQRLRERIQALKATGLFEYVEPDYLVRPLLLPNDAAFRDGRLWGLQNLGQDGGLPGADIAAPAAWDLTTGSTNVIVAVIDTGIRYSHLDLTNRMWKNPLEIPGNGIDDDENGYVDDVFGIDATTDTGDPMDTDDHGTHVAGTIGAAANDGNPHVGVAWNVRLMACKFIGDLGFGSTSDAIECIDYAVAHGAKILNNSWGGGGFSQALFDSIQRARDAGVLFVAAAGNDGTDNDQFPHYPSNYQLDNIISVAALDRTDRLAYFSNYGQETVHLGAPGVEIFSSTSTFDRAYDFFDGTSMAAPHVSGVAALVWSLYPEADLEEVRDRILAGAVPISALNRRTVTGGRLNAYQALTVTGEGVLQISVDPPSGATLLNGSDQPIVVRVRDRFGIRDATVIARIVGGGALDFTNDGQPPDEVAGDSRYTALLNVPVAGDSLSLVLVVEAPGKVGVTNRLDYTLVPRPPNDPFASPLKVPANGAVYISNNRFATIEAGEPAHGGYPTTAGSLWWSWLAPATTNVLVDATGTTFDSVLAVYTGNVLTNLQPVATITNVSGRRAYLFFNAQAGRTYSIALAGVRSNVLGSLRLRIAPGGRLQTDPPTVAITSPRSGTRVGAPLVTLAGTAADTGPVAAGVVEVLVSLNEGIAAPANGTTNWTRNLLLRPGRNTVRVRSVNAAGLMSEVQTIDLHYLVIRPSNDDFANAETLVGSSGLVVATNSLATVQPGEPQHAGNPGGRSLWWKWQAPADGSLLLSTEGSSFDTLLAVYTGDLVSALTRVAENDDALEGSGFSKVQHAVRAQTWYAIAVDGYNGATGVVRLAHAFTPGPVFNLTVSHTTGGITIPAAGKLTVLANTAQQLRAVPDPTSEFARWEGDVSTAENPVSLIVSRDLAVRAVFRPLPISDDFESGNLSRLPWQTGGQAPWFVTDQSAAAGRYAVRSGRIDHGQESRLQLTHAMREGRAAFDLRVSSEANWDFLEFYLNGNLLRRWSGQVDWTRFEFPVSAGTHTLEWRYVKDAANSGGLDAVFVDNVLLPLAVPDDGTVPRLRASRTLAGGVQIQLTGQTNQVYVIQAADSLPPRWRGVHTNVATHGEIIFIDPEVPGSSERYYRAVKP